LLCEEQATIRSYRVAYILEQTPLKLIVYDPRTNRLENRNELSILIASRFHPTSVTTCSAPQGVLARPINALNANAARRAQ